ncbi:MAG: Hsp20/alpha crystallin family protein [Desulfomonilaceae bacterium]
MLKLVPWRWGDREMFPSLGAFRGKLDYLLKKFPVKEVSRWTERPEFSPAIDISETEKEIIVKVELPGIDQEDVEISLSGATLKISGEKKDEKKEEGEHFHRVERSFGRFAMSLPLPCRVQEKEIKAEYKDGVLSVKIPKAEWKEIGQERLQVPGSEKMTYRNARVEPTESASSHGVAESRRMSFR